jgi:hypothetical protein
MEKIMSEQIDPKTAKFVSLEGIDIGNRFWTGNNPDEDPTKLYDGTVAYRVLGYANTPEDAIKITQGDDKVAYLLGVHEAKQKEREEQFGDNVPEAIAEMDNYSLALLANDVLSRD